MLHSNQIITITGELSDLDDLAKVIGLAVELTHGKDMFVRSKDPVKLAWKPAEDGSRFYLGCGSMGPESPAPDGWTDVPGPYDPEAAAKQVRKWLASKPVPNSDCDGITEPGFLCEYPNFAMLDGTGEEDPEDWTQYIAAFRPYVCEFEK